MQYVQGVPKKLIPAICCFVTSLFSGLNFQLANWCAWRIHFC